MNSLSAAERQCMLKQTVALPRGVRERLSIWLNQANDDPLIEVEVRFTRNAIDRTAWQAVKAHLSANAVSRTTEDSVVDICRNGVRVCNGTAILKEKRCHIDLDSYGVRFALSREIPVHAQSSSAPTTRRRWRESFIMAHEPIRFDCTHVVSDGVHSYEIEIEYVAANRLPGTNAAQTIETIANGIHSVLAVIQGSEFVLSADVSDRLSQHYRSFFGIRDRTYFVGAQPTSLHKSDVRTIRAGSYHVTDKPDGERGLIVAYPDGCMYLLGRRLTWRCLHVPAETGPHLPEHKGLSVIDVEVIEGGRFVAIDMLVDNGLDLRGRRDEHLTRRCERLRLWIDSSTRGASQDRVHVSIKEYVPYRWGMSVSLATLMGDGDGLIFVPEHEPYPCKPRWLGLLKWKPPQHNSIDVAVSNSVPYVGGDNGQLVKFAPRDRELPVRCSAQSTLRTEDIADMDIVECTYDAASGSLVPKRVRRDKTRPNYKSVAMDVWRSICEPVALKQLHIGHAEALRIHLNYVRNSQAHKVMRMLPAEVTTVNALDLKPASDQLRLSTAATKCNKVLRYHEAKAPDTLDVRGSFHVIQLHQSLDGVHYSSAATFASYMDHVAQHLAPGGLISVICMDGCAVLETSRWGGTGCATVQPHSFDPRLFAQFFDPSDDFGARYTLVPHATLKKPTSTMNLIMPDAFTLHMEQFGLQLVSTARYPDPIDQTIALSPEESEFSALHRTAIFAHAQQPTPRWRRAEGWLAMSLPVDALISTCTDSASALLHMTTGLWMHGTHDMDALATRHSTIVCVLDEIAHQVSWHNPAHLAHIDQPYVMYLVRCHEEYHVVGRVGTGAPHPPPVFVLWPMPTVETAIQDSTPPEQTEYAKDKLRILDVLRSRDIDRRSGSWTIKELCEYAKSEPLLSSFRPGSMKKQEIYEALVRIVD